MTILHENGNNGNTAKHIGCDFPEDELWEMFAALHQEVLDKVFAADNMALEREFCEVTAMWRWPVAFQFNALYLFAEKHGMIRVNMDGVE